MFCSEIKQRQNLCLNNEAEAWKKTPPAIAALLLNFQELSALLWLLCIGCLAQL